MAKGQGNQIEHRNVFVQNIIDSIGDPLMVIDASNYRLILVNKAMWGGVTGIDPVAMSMTCHEFSHHRSAPCEGLDDPCPLKKVIATRAPVRVTHVHRDDNNNEIIVDIVATPVFDDNGNVVQVIESFHDVTTIVQDKIAAQESEKKFRTLFENAGDAIFIHDLEGHFIEVNLLASDRLGYTKDELLQMTTMELDSPEYAIMLPAKIKELRDNGHTVFETVHLRKDGLPIPTEISSRMIEYAGKPAVLSIARDIRDRKLDEAALQKERDMAQKYLDVAGVMIVVIDLDQRVTLINKKGAEILGYGEDEIIGKNWFDNFISPSIKDIVKDDYVKLINGDIEPIEYFENTVMANNNAEKIIAWHNTILRDESGSITGILSSGEDINERKQAEETLRVSEERYRSLVENLPDGIFVHDLYRYIFVNEVVTKMLGAKDPEEIIGTNVLDLVHPDYRDMVRERIDRERKGESVPLIEIKLLKVDGTPFDVEVSAFPVMYKNKMEVYSIARDISKRKQAEEELKKYSDELSKANEELKSVDQMKDEFLSNVSHELKTPLVSIEGYSQAMREQILGTLNEQQKKVMDTIIRNAARLERLISSILYLSIAKSGKFKYDFKSIQIADLIKNSVRDMLPMAENRGLDLKNEVPDNLSFIQGDSDMLGQVMDNLIGNAIKFTSSGEITITASEDDDDLHITVSDTGIGISQELIGNLFKKFYQGDGSTTRRYGGTGIGLHISKLIVEAHNGKIWAESKEGVGTTVHFTLPMKI